MLHQTRYYCYRLPCHVDSVVLPLRRCRWSGLSAWCWTSWPHRSPRWQKSSPTGSSRPQIDEGYSSMSKQRINKWSSILIMKWSNIKQVIRRCSNPGLSELLERCAAVQTIGNSGDLDTVEAHPHSQLTVLVALIRLSYHLNSKNHRNSTYIEAVKILKSLDFFFKSWLWPRFFIIEL